MHTCPHCGQPGISSLRKSLLGPGAEIVCEHCKQAVRIEFKPWLKAALPGALLMTGAAFLESTALMYGLSAAGLALMIGLHLAWVPLVKTNSTPS